MGTNNHYLRYVKRNNSHRIAGISFILFTTIYLIWLIRNLNTSAFYISYPFLAFQIFSFIFISISIINNWKGVYRTKRPKLPDDPPPCAVVVPTLREPISVIRQTLKSLLNLTYPGKVVIILSNDDNRIGQKTRLLKLMEELSEYWRKKVSNSQKTYQRSLFLINTKPHKDAKAGNLNQSLKFLKMYHPEINLLLTQDADELVYPDILEATVGYFQNSLVAYVQTIKQSAVSKDDPFGNRDLMWYCRTAASRDSVNAMFACGSGVVWKISALKSIDGFSTWNLVEDLTTSYQLLSMGWQGRYHYEALSYGLAPEDLPNFIKQRGTWAIDHLRLFFWDNPLTKKDLTIFQRLQFLEPSLFYLNGFLNLTLVIVTSASLLWEVWPTRVDALTHAQYLIPSFLSLEIYYLLLAENIPFRRIRQFWVGLAPVFSIAAVRALIFGPNNKPPYIVTRKENIYGNYISLVLPQIITLSLILVSLVTILISTPLYSAFDWAAVFWGFYQASFFLQPIKVSWWNWAPMVTLQLTWGNFAAFVRQLLINNRYRFARSLEFRSPHSS